MNDFSDIALKLGRKKPKPSSKGALPQHSDAVDVITFVESPWGLNLRLYPVQRVILKAHYGIALDDNANGYPLDVPVPKDHPKYDPDLIGDDGYYLYRVPIRDWRGQNAQVLTEAGYLKFLYDCKPSRSNIRKVIPGQERRELILPIGRRSGKCIIGNSLVLTNRGLLRISDMGNSQGPVIQPLQVEIAQEGLATRAQSAYFYNGGIQQTFAVQSYAGMHIEGTGKHRVKVLQSDGVVGWCRLNEITPGTMLAVHRTSDLWAQDMVDVRSYQTTSLRPNTCVQQPAFFDESWGLLFGYLVGDGSWTCPGWIEVTVEHPETKNEVETLLKTLCGKCTYKPDKRTKRTGGLQVCDKAFRTFLHNLGYRLDLTSDTKRTPWVILQSPKPVVRAYLQALFETDGSITKSGQVVSFCSASKELARETQILLLNFGVTTRIRVKHNKKYDRDYYEIVLLGLRSRQTFAREIGFRSRKKQEPLERGLSSSKEGGDSESIPFQQHWISQLLASVPKQKAGGGWQRSTLRAVVGNVCKPGSTENLTYSRIQALLPVGKAVGADPSLLAHFQDLLDSDYYFDPVVGVTQGEAPVYDLNVPVGESFVANGLTNHNTLLSSCIAAYETYKLIHLEHPQKYYGLPDSNVIQIISIATDKDQAGLLYREVQGHFLGCSLYGGYLVNATQSFATFQTPHDIERFGSSAESNNKTRFSIKVTFRSCVARGLRGAGNIVVILDEVAHFVEDGQSGAEQIYDAVVPSTSAFSPKDPHDNRVPIGPVEGRVVLISSPLGRQGLFHKLFQIGMGGGTKAENMLCIQAPTWEVNPSVPIYEFEKNYAKDPRVFFTEFGGQFTDRTLGWLEDARDLENCIVTNAKPRTKAPPLMPHFLGLDVALVNDATAIAIGHIDDKHNIVVDLVDTLKAPEGDRLDLEEVAHWVEGYTKKFYISKGMFDQWAGIPFEQALVRLGIKQIEMVRHTRSFSSDMYRNLKALIMNQQLVLYDFPKIDDQHCSYIQELLELQAEMISKYIIDVAAPKAAGKHDDQADALARMVWLASDHENKTVSFGGNRLRNDLANGNKHLVSPMAILQARRKAMLGGSHVSRQPRAPQGNNLVLNSVYSRRGR